MSDPTALARRFPAGFLFGTATAAYQIEGGHDADGKGLSIWDTFCRRPGAISTGETGDVACDHYHRWREDVALLRELGCNAYRLSISWPRVLPSGTGAVNEAGLAFYDRLIDELLANRVRPFVTLYHWDLPQALQENGGWSAPRTVAAFGRYADVIARRLGDRVQDWMTLNEPEVVAYAGHYVGVHAPGMRDFATAVGVSHHLLLAHRAAADAIRAAHRDARVGIALNLSPCDPASDAPADLDAAARMDGYLNRWFLDPLFGRGYPKDMLDLYGAYFDRGRELEGYDGRLDFLGVNYYARRIVRAGTGPLRADRVEPQRAERTAIGWEVHPLSLRKLLVRLHHEYAPAHLYITENGAAYDDTVVDDRVTDPDRVSFLARHFDAAAGAIADGVPLRGYFIWTLMDNFEWAHGTSKRFGIVHTDYATQRRRVKASGEWYRRLIAAHRAVRTTSPVPRPVRA
jgi:beta-glucosidase